MATGIINPFDDPAFGAAELTEAMTLIPNNYGRIGQMGLFTERGVTTDTIKIESRNQQLCLLNTADRGAPAREYVNGKRLKRSFIIPHIPFEAEILPQEYKDLLAFGNEQRMAALTDLMTTKLADMRRNHDITREWLRVGALHGNILDADGSVIYNLYDEFGITEKEINFELSTTTTDVRKKCFELSRWIEDNMMGDTHSSVMVECSPEFFDALVSHKSVKEAFANYQEAAQRLGGDMRDGFTFGGITFREYRGKATNLDGKTMHFIPKDTARAYPLGTQQTFRLYNGSSDFLENVNAPGVAYYAKQEARKFNRGIDIHTQSNPLPLCLRPQVLVKLLVS